MKLKIPTPEELDPELRRLQDARHKAFFESAKLKTAISILRSKGLNASPGNSNDNRVREILGEKPLPNESPDSQKLGELLRELDAMNRAAEILDRRVQDQMRSASAKVCEQVAGENTRLVKKFAQAIMDLHAAHKEYALFHDAVANTGASTTALRYVCPSMLGSPFDASGSYMYGLKEFYEAGHIDNKDPLGLIK